ncbi:MAG: hypothetical protein WCJ07_04075 [Verrucomicrobiota bacterium]
MNANSLASDLKLAQQQREQEARTNSERQQTEWQNYLRAESQLFKSFIAGAESRCRRLMLLALAVTMLAALLASALMLTAAWRTARAESQLHQLQTEIIQSQDKLAKLRAAQFVPVGQPVRTQGRTFIEIQNAE